MARPRITKTYGPIHFEDLDPHRFEDLVRELLYDYKNWQSIEAAGRSGSDYGFDVRAYERVEDSPRSGDEEEDKDIHPMNGNLWMIQCKRERTIGPKRVATIISDAIDEKTPPYGFILAAPANFSKNSYDRFRSELHKRGIMEFYIWGKAELEDMLHFPKNDRVLFTFFGISLVTKKRSLTTEVRFAVNNKNKLLRIFGERINGLHSILLRDLKDSEYPYKERYKDFKKNPRWQEYIAREFHPLGLEVQVAKFYAYIDSIKREWDYTHAVNLIHRQSESDEDRRENQENQTKVEGVWEYFPRAHQAKLIVYGMVRFDAMAVVDEKGDSWHQFPHIFVDFQGSRGPFVGFLEFLEKNGTQISLKDYTRKKFFPESFGEPRLGEVHRSKSIVWDDETHRRFKERFDRFYSLYDCDGKYGFLMPGDVIPVANANNSTGEIEYIRITHKVTKKMKTYLEENKEIFNLGKQIEQQVGRAIHADENVDIYEFKRAYKWEFEPKT